MSERSNHDPNGHVWTFASLREYLLRIVADLSTAQTKLADAQDKAVQAALVAQEKAVQAALAAADKAVQKAEEGAQRWQESANEWRGAMSDRERTFIARTEFEAAARAFSTEVTRIAKVQDDQSAKSIGSAQVIAYMVGVVGLLIGIAGVAARLLAG